MPRTCAVCKHPSVSEINESLLRNEAYRSIAKRFAASESAVFRHERAPHLFRTSVRALVDLILDLTEPVLRSRSEERSLCPY